MAGGVLHQIVDSVMRREDAGLWLFCVVVVGDCANHVLSQASRSFHQPLVQSRGFVHAHGSLRCQLVEDAFFFGLSGWLVEVPEG